MSDPHAHVLPVPILVVGEVRLVAMFTCRRCGIGGRGQTERVELRDSTVDGLCCALQAHRPEAFPVGWTSFGGVGGRTEYQCGRCCRPEQS